MRAFYEPDIARPVLMKSCVFETRPAIDCVSSKVTGVELPVEMSQVPKAPSGAYPRDLKMKQKP